MGQESHLTSPHIYMGLTHSMWARSGARGCLGTRDNDVTELFRCVGLSTARINGFANGSAKGQCGGRRNQRQVSFTKAIRPLFSLGSQVQFSFQQRIFPFPTPGHILATLSSPSGWATSECFPYRVVKALKEFRRPPAVWSWAGRDSCGPRAPSCGDARDDGLLPKVRSPSGRNVTPLGSWALSFRQSGQAW